ncbi:hypothetical protein M409DRAFT_68938 [Zasmidium cellare ATCC 36951]|uniref:AB hydrolase-1 domain-containing protein n=1 Tax=Zasmidium cellare ATCC 36951 TaxID=1080233 RepID=A0A6A6CAZ5_ZASCE|nr:uncharacterized protein M409DRAFT_68938 [Zasmidium cellare ATCC 36951]KAF2162626.1 hypothetical protein M409DRAFT_68938 [Zasmidium cellare ATCC 36951]
MATPWVRTLAIGCILSYILAVEAALNCRDITIPVSASALNFDFPATLNLTKLVSGTFHIDGTYCEPSKAVASRRNTLQILSHGITYDRKYWSGTQFNTSIYSWVQYAANEGYPTLALDRLCYGTSSHPNGVLVCQEPMNAEIMHQILQKARRGQIAGRSFEKIVYVGHSLGSLIGNVLAQIYPADVDSYILTGFTPFLAIGGFEFILALAPLPSILIDPVRFPTPDLAYLIATSPSGAQGTLYYGDYDPAVAAQDYATRGTYPLGEIATVPLGQLPALGYTNSVLVMNGEHDQVFCTRVPTDPLVGYRGNCGEGEGSYTAQTRLLFPNVKAFEFENVEETGHDVDYHRTAQEAFAVAHGSLSRQGF